MHFSILAVSCFALAVVAQNVNCGPKYGNRICDAGQCCAYISPEPIMLARWHQLIHLERD